MICRLQLSNSKTVRALLLECHLNSPHDNELPAEVERHQLGGRDGAARREHRSACCIGPDVAAVCGSHDRGGADWFALPLAPTEAGGVPAAGSRSVRVKTADYRC